MSFQHYVVLMMNIRDIGKKYKVFTFIKGLNPCGRMEMQRQRVYMFPKAI